MVTIMAINMPMQNAMENNGALANDARHAAPHRLKKWAVIGGLIISAILIIAVQLGQAALYNKQWVSALLFPASSGEASAKIASSMLAQQDMDQAAQYAQSALNSALVHVEALRTLGITKFNDGDEENGRKLVLLSADLSWRDSPTQAWLFEKSLSSGDYEQSIRHADALLRRNRARKEIFGIFTLAANRPDLAQIVTQKIANNPPWRANFFADAPETINGQYRGFDNIVTGMKNTDAPATPKELEPYTSMLVAKGETASALKSWANAFPTDSAIISANKSLSLRWATGDLGNSISQMGWILRQSRSFESFVTQSNSADSAMLNLNLDRRALGRITQRAVIIPAGELTLEIASDAQDKNDMRNLRWFLECNQTKPNSANEFPLLPTDDPLIWKGNINGQCAVYNLVMAVKLGGVTKPLSLNIGDIIIAHKNKADQ